jgi:hypothetical protein
MTDPINIPAPAGEQPLEHNYSCAYVVHGGDCDCGASVKRQWASVPAPAGEAGKWQIADKDGVLLSEYYTDAQLPNALRYWMKERPELGPFRAEEVG